MGNRYRPHSAQYVLNHLDYLVNTHGVNHFHFEDDNLTLDRERFHEILNGIEKRKIRLTWDTPNGVRADTLDRAVLEQCKRTGCVYLILGVESGDQHVLDHIIQKKLSLTTIFEIAACAGEVGIDLRSFFVIGFPGETRTHIANTFEVALRLHKKFRVQPNLMFATPLLGTRLFDICHEKGYLTEPVTPAALAVSTSGRGIIQTEHFDPDQLCDLRDRFSQQNRKIYLANFVKGLFRSPRFVLYILLNALKKTKGIRACCADTVLFYHFLRSSPNTPLKNSSHSGSRGRIFPRRIRAAPSDVA
jgi:radical SAM superfamily enzyme YgiQ (UPF0313 family)